MNGFPQNLSGLIVPDGSVSFQLNIDATIIASPFGFVAAQEVVTFQFNALGQIQPNFPASAAQIYSNLELNPQNANGLGTYYLVTFYDANGARINNQPMWWQFANPANATVDIGEMTPYITAGGNVIFYPTITFGTVTAVTFTGDGTVLSSVPTSPVTSTGTLTSTLNTQAAHAVLIGPTSGPVALPTFRSLILADLPTQTGTGSIVLSTSPVLVTPNIGTPSAGVLTNCTGLPTVSAIQFVIDGGGFVPATGSWGQIQIPYGCTITSVTLTADQSGSAVIDLLKSTYAGFPGSLTSIAASDKPTLSTAQKYTDSTLTGWTTALSAGDILQIYLDSVTTCTRLNLTVTLSVLQ